MVAYSSKGCVKTADVSTWLLVGAVVVFSLAFAIGIPMQYASDHNPEPVYEIEMEDGTIHVCHKYEASKDGTTTLKGVDHTKGELKVFTHLIVRSERI